jgi:DNA segregation ATPase FtsK/SpoIIIE-like protein
MLVAGTAGSSKSIWWRSAITSLVETNTRETFQLVLIDPKRNAFTAWKDCEHLRSPIVFPDEVSVVDVLDELIAEMESRYSRMTGVDDLAGLIQQESRRIPRIVCVCDEYADLMAAADDKKEIEKRIVRLGQKARAAGIHLILATQTPRRDIIGGAIKANLPSYVALRVACAIEARIVEAPSAELLLGNGELLFKSIGPPVRLQGCGREPRNGVAGRGVAA